jgi:hypothetical protein
MTVVQITSIESRFISSSHPISPADDQRSK